MHPKSINCYRIRYFHFHCLLYLLYINLKKNNSARVHCIVFLYDHYFEMDAALISNFDQAVILINHPKWLSPFTMSKWLAF